jgi:hypothetical protein
MNNKKYVLLTFMLFFLLNSFVYSQNHTPSPAEYLGIIRISSFCTTDSVRISSNFLRVFAENNPERKNEAETAIILIEMGGLLYATKMSTFINNNLPPSAYCEIGKLAIEFIKLIIDTLSEKEADDNYINQLNNHIVTINTVLTAFNLSQQCQSPFLVSGTPNCSLF